MKTRLLTLLLLSVSAFGTTPVTGHIANLNTGTPGTSSFVRFILGGMGGNQPRITGTGAIAPLLGGNGLFYVDLPADASGNVSGTIYSTRDAAGTGNGEIEVGGSYTAVYYRMFIYNNGIPGPEIRVHAKSGSTLDIANVTPISTSPVVTAPTGDTTYFRLDGGNSPITGGFTSQGPNSFTGSNTFCLIDGAYIAASTCYPTTQLAITAAGTTGMVEIPPSVSLTDSYQNNNNLPVLDWRGGIEGPRIWSQIGTSHNVKDPTGVVIPDGNDIVLVSRGAADVHLKNIPEDVTSTTTVVGAGTVTITVSNCNTAAGGNWYAGAGLNVEPPPGASSNYEFIASGSWSCLSSTQLSATFAKAHTQPFHIRQQGVLFLDGYAMKPSPDPGSVLQFYSIADANGNVAIYLPLTNGAFPANAPSLSAVFTGANSTNNNINFRNYGASSQFLLSNSANTFNLVSIDDNGNDIRNGTAGGLFIKNSGTQVCALQNSGGTGLMTCDIWRMNGTTASVGNIRFTSGGAFNFRNNAGGADVNGVSKNTTDVVLLGGSAGIGLSAGNMLLSPTAPTISSGFGTSPSIANNNGTAAFVVNVGTGGSATNGVIGMPTATTGWNCSPNNITAAAGHRADNTRQTASTVSSVTIENQTTSTGAALAWTASDIVRMQCAAY